MTKKIPQEIDWYELSQAAAYLGIHFTTLRRWADEGEIEFMRTPGGKRRFRKAALDRFLNRHSENIDPTSDQHALSALMENQALNKTRAGIQGLNHDHSSWMHHISPEDRLRMRNTGNRIMVLLMQYNAQGSNAEVYLEEGKRIAAEYGMICYQAGLSVADTIQAFMLFRTSILEAVYETSGLDTISNQEGNTLYHRTSGFLDQFLMGVINTFCEQKNC